MGASGAQPLTYQWYSNNVAIAGGTNATYATPPVLVANSGNQYKVAVSNSFSGVISSNATLTVIPDTNIVHALSVGSLDGASIGVLFSGDIDPVSAGSAANYTVSGATIASVSVRTNIANFGDPSANYAPSYLKTVRLNLNQTLTGGYTVTVSSNVLSQTLKGRPYNTTLVGNVAGLVNADIGTPGTDPLSPGESFSGASNLLEVVGSGDTYVTTTGTTGDYGQEAYYSAPRTDDFDIAADCYFETPTAGNAKVGIFARPNATDSFSPVLAFKILPAYLESAMRAAQGPGTSTSLWNSGPYHPANNAPGPNWVRLKRVGTTYSDYYSTNGINWIFEASYVADTNSFLVAEYVGFFACAANNDGRLCEADFANYGPVSFPPAGITITSDLLPSYTNASIPAGELSYQWQRAEPNAPTVFNSIMDGTGNGPQYTTPVLEAGADNGAKYRAIAFVGDITSGNGATSSVATLTVLYPVGPPYILSASADSTSTTITIMFDKAVNNTTISSPPATYSISPVGGGSPIGVSSETAIYNQAGGTVGVILSLASPLASGARYTLTVSGVQDLNGALIDNTTVPGGKGRTVTGWVVAQGYLVHPQSLYLTPLGLDWRSHESSLGA